MNISDYLIENGNNALPKNEDFQVLALPFLKALQRAHLQNKVLLSNGLDELAVINNSLVLRELKLMPAKKSEKQLYKKPAKGAVKVVGEVTMTVSTETGNSKSTLVGDFDNPSNKPQYYPDLCAWEELQGHYDPITEIFKAGLVLCSLAFGLHLNTEEGLTQFINNREQIHRYNPDLHASIVKVLMDMTALYREDRLRSLESAIIRIEEFGTFNPEANLDLTTLTSFKEKAKTDRKAWILERLKSRLYDISRRNKLIYFQPQKSFVNLTVSSVPVLLDHTNIIADKLFIWNGPLSDAIEKQKKIDLQPFLHINEKSYLLPRVDRIRLDARKAVNEFGLNPMRLVVAYLHWFNFKENQNEKIFSPLLLLPVSLKKKKGVRDRFVLTPADTQLEVNPVLAHYLKDLFDLRLPTEIEPSESAIEALIQSLQQQISASQLGIEMSWVKRPEIELIHSVAQRDFSINIRRSNRRKRGFRASQMSYSYSDENFQPLGLQIFRDKVKYKHSELEFLINEDLQVNEDNMAAEKSRTFYTLRNEGTHNPFHWQVDTCNITLGNFNYRKMGLVGDYESIVEKEIESPTFSELFSDGPKAIFEKKETVRNLEKDHSIIASDPTQARAISHARVGKNYIIQGPPGTGKSQTITNLIAQYIADNKKVLFVCEKRAALDVVFHRLKQKKLDELCCLVHDSQSDKKAFVMDLKETYNTFLKEKMNAVAIEKERALVVSKMEDAQAKLARYHSFFVDSNAEENYRAKALLEIILAYDGEGIDEEKWNDFPLYKHWLGAQDFLPEWRQLIRDAGWGNYVADYPLARCGATIFDTVSPSQKVSKLCDQIAEPLDLLQELCDGSELPENQLTTVAGVKAWLETLNTLYPIVQRKLLPVYVEGSAEQNALKAQWQSYLKQEKKQAKLNAKTDVWKSKLSVQDTSSALVQWTKYQRNFFRFLMPGFWKLKKMLHEQVDLSQFKIDPDFSELLSDLQRAYESQADLSIMEEEIKAKLGDGELEEGVMQVLEPDRKRKALVDLVLERNLGDEVEEWGRNKSLLDQLIRDLTSIDGQCDSWQVASIEQRQSSWKKAALSLSSHIPYLKQAAEYPASFRRASLSESWSLATLEYASAFKSFNLLLEINPGLRSMDAAAIRYASGVIKKGQSRLQELNVDYLRSRIRQVFSEKVALAERSVSGLGQSDRHIREQYRAARKVLENEFGKSMRYKSIRELSTGPARHLLIGLKPVWLMSPMSVSDVLTLDTNLFDVVIFDEASQITLEDGIPALFRAKQTIIVGDEMQMPPTQFFSSSQLNIDEEEDEDLAFAGISLDADSLLNQGVRKLDSEMLGWHYRSRHESLISFCNAAFYDHGLLTIPDVRYHSHDLMEMEEMVALIEDNGDVDCHEILARSISFHHLPDAVYKNRCNRDEADYIARLVKNFLKDRPELTIGVVAFSMQQQGEIEEALERLSERDKEFDKLLDEAYNRVEDNQIVSLFVKNLENVQGDERDIIIMSVCYGPNESGKMLMNFGPINKRGGEKRLNVIFSRAKQHMAVVSSIQHKQITNDYNEGALYFKRFLEYAEHISMGDIERAQGVIEQLAQKGYKQQQQKSRVLSDIAKHLETKGYSCDTHIGQSKFKVHLAIRPKQGRTYQLGIVLDDDMHYTSPDVVEQYCQKPAVLNGFGWDTYHLYAKDWLIQPQMVLEEIEQKLSGRWQESEPELDIEEQERPIPEENLEEKVLNSDQGGSEVDAKKTVVPEGFLRLEFISETSRKFWQYAVVGLDVVVQFGRIGTKGQERRKSYATGDAAQKAGISQMNKKIAKGYVKVS